MVLVSLSACGGGGGGSSTSAIPSKIVFSENGNIYSVSETGGVSAVADRKSVV